MASNPLPKPKHKTAVKPPSSRPRKPRPEPDVDRMLIQEAERRLADPTDGTVPYEDARRRLGLADLSPRASKKR